MIKRCVYCPKPHNFGQVAPLADRRVTHGMCPAAAAREHARLDADGYPPAPLFFGRDIEVLSRPLDGDMTTRRTPEAA
jgi:hypothetical protein